jgi:hypothetical protein
MQMLLLSMVESSPTLDGKVKWLMETDKNEPSPPTLTRHHPLRICEDVLLNCYCLEREERCNAYHLALYLVRAVLLSQDAGPSLSLVSGEDRGGIEYEQKRPRKRQRRSQRPDSANGWCALSAAFW